MHDVTYCTHIYTLHTQIQSLGITIAQSGLDFAHRRSRTPCLPKASSQGEIPYKKEGSERMRPEEASPAVSFAFL